MIEQLASIILSISTLAQPCSPPEPLEVWVTCSGVGIQGGEMYQYEHLLPGQYVWSGMVPTTCAQWATPGLSCLHSIVYVPLSTWSCTGEHLFNFFVDGEPCPDRLNPQYRQYFTAENWWWNRGDVNWDGTVDSIDIWTLTQWIAFKDIKADWNGDELANAKDLNDYLNHVWIGEDTGCNCP